MIAYEEFVEYLKVNVATVLGVDEYEVEFSDDFNENGTLTHMLWFTDKYKRKKGLRTELLYEQEYKKGKSLGEVCLIAIKDFEKEEEKADNFQSILELMVDFERAKKRLVVKPLNLKKNSINLEQFIFRKVTEDIAIFLCITIDESEDLIGSARVTRNFLGHWEVTEDYILDFAIKNMSKKYAPVIVPLGLTMIKGTDFENSYPPEKILFMDKKNYRGLAPDLLNTFFLSVLGNVNGSVAAFYPGVLERIGELVREDFYLVITTSNSCIIYPCSTSHAPHIKGIMKREMSVTVDLPWQKVLSDKLYLYKCSLKKLTTVA